MVKESKYYQGKYKPKFPEKYAGDPTDVIYRSSWELKFMNWCDSESAIIKWSSESTIIPYRCGTDNKLHRYFVDFKIQVKTKDGVKTYLVEIKPLAQTMPPKFPGKQTKRYLTESMTFIKNQSKWNAAEQYCKDRGWEFMIITEKQLGI
jgi:hypothetical protein